MPNRVFNFSPGPAVLPLSVLREAQRDLVELPGLGMSILEISHRSAAFEKILAETEANLRKLLDIPSNYRVLFLQGGSLLEFSMIPKNLLQAGKPGDYVVTGTWGKKALQEGALDGEVRAAWDGAATKYDRLPEASALQFSPAASYIHLTSNETIQGVQFPAKLDWPANAAGGAPLVCDSSSDFLSRPAPVEQFGMIYACAQKNAGPAGVTVVILRDDLLERSPKSLPGILNYRVLSENNSLYNTPPTFAIYMVLLVTRWLLHEIGGLARMAELNSTKASWLYEAIDESHGFYQGHARPECRSQMNVTFRLKDAETEKAFLAGAKQLGLDSLEGHRSVGGIRASIYNAMPAEGVQRLQEFMREFRRQHS